MENLEIRLKHYHSAKLLERSKKVLAGGVSSEFRKFNHPHALFYDSASGVHIKDIDGNEYLDFSLSQGPMIVGHSHPHVIKRIEASISKGQLFAGQHQLEVELAEKINYHIPSAEIELIQLICFNFFFSLFFLRFVHQKYGRIFLPLQ